MSSSVLRGEVWAALLLFVQSLIIRTKRVLKIYVAVKKKSLAWHIAEDDHLRVILVWEY